MLASSWYSPPLLLVASTDPHHYRRPLQWQCSSRACEAWSSGAACCPPVPLSSTMLSMTPSLHCSFRVLGSNQQANATFWTAVSAVATLDLCAANVASAGWH